MKETEILQLLRDIERGKVKLKKSPPTDCLSDHYGNVKYEIDNSWVLWVFFDCGGWDYLDRIISPAGDRLEFDEFSEKLKGYCPPEKVRREIYGSPGYLGCYLRESNP